MWQQSKLCQLWVVSLRLEVSSVLFREGGQTFGLYATNCRWASKVSTTTTRTTILQSPFCWLRNIEAILKCEYAAMSQAHSHIHIRTGNTHLHSHSPTHTHSHSLAETLLTRSVGFSFAFCVCLLGLRFSLVVAAVCGLRYQVTSFQFRPLPPLVLELGHVHPLPLAYISLALPLPLLLPPCACPFGYKLNFRICLEIHLLNYFATRTQLFPSIRCPPPSLLYSPVASLFNFFILASCKYEKWIAFACAALTAPHLLLNAGRATPMPTPII